MCPTISTYDIQNDERETLTGAVTGVTGLSGDSAALSGVVLKWTAEPNGQHSNGQQCNGQPGKP